MVHISDKITLKKVHELKPYDRNNKQHPDAQVEKLALSIQTFGFRVPIIIDDHDLIIAGHGRLLAAKKLGLDEVPCIVADNLTTDQIKAFRIMDNKSAVSEFEEHNLKLELEELQLAGFDMTLTGFDSSELQDVGVGVPSEVVEVEAEDAETVKTEIQDGDVFTIGKHRLMCGDSTDYQLVWEKLCKKEKIDMCFTDPPYNTGMTAKGNNGSTRLNHMFDDSFTDEEWDLFIDKFTSVYYSILKDNSVAYVCLDWRRNHELIPKLKKNGFHLSNVIVWDKVVHGLGSDYKYTYELINVCKKGKLSLNTHQGEREYSDVWHIQRKMGKDEDHATKKPIELCARAIRHVTADSVVDLFGGSGSTMVACEQLNRTCYMMELDPRYCSVILRRMRKLNPNIEIKCENRDFKLEEELND